MSAQLLHPIFDRLFPRMVLPRASMSSARSVSSTAVDPQSALSSPKVVQHSVEQWPSAEHRTYESQSTKASSSPSITSERYIPQNRYGWPRLAEIMADVPEFAAFPRYRELNIKSLLYYKAQIENIRVKMLKQEEETSLQLERFDEIADEADSTYHHMLLELRLLLKGYSMSLLKVAQ